MTIDKSNDEQPLAVTVSGKSSLPAQLQRYNRKVQAWVAAKGGALQTLDPIWIPGMIEPVFTDGAVGGVNDNMINENVGGLLIIIQAYQNMGAGDWIRVYWGDDSSPVASDSVKPDQVDKDFAMQIRPEAVPEGVNTLYCTVTRAGGGNGGTSTHIDVLVRTDYPGGTDPRPELPDHQNLPAPRPDLPDSGIIDEDAAKNGVKVTIDHYPNMRVYDTLLLHWGGVLVQHGVTQAEVDAGEVVITVTEEIIREAGDSDELGINYWVYDEVHNRSSDWSPRTVVVVEVGEGLFSAPLIENPDTEADPYDLIDLDDLGEDDLLIQVVVFSNGLIKDDVIELTWVGTTAEDETIEYVAPPKTVQRDPEILVFMIPNDDVRKLARGRGVASYTVTRDGVLAGASKRDFARFIGSEVGLPKPVIADAVGGTLDPTLASTTVTVPGEVLEPGDYIYMIWLGTRADGSTLLYQKDAPIGGGGGGKPVVFPIDGPENIAPLDGGTVTVYYRLYKGSLGRELQSERELLMVGETRAELPAPATLPSADSGFIDPADLPGGQLQITIAAYPGMKAGQTVHLTWDDGGGAVDIDYMPITPPLEGKEVPFFMDRATFEGYLGALIKLSYWVEDPDAPPRLSAVVTFTVGAGSVPLPAPTVLEAVDGILNPSAALDGATVQIPVSVGLVHGDYVEVQWRGDKPGGVHTELAQVHPEDIGKPFDVIIDYEYVIANADGNVVVTYKVLKLDGGTPQSDPLSLRVQSATLPLPKITQAEGDELNPDDVLDGATVMIDASARFQEHDHVVIRIISSAEGGSVILTHDVPSGGAGQPVTVRVEHHVINASNGVSIDLEYEITRDAGGEPEKSDKVTYRVSREVGDGPLKVLGARYNLCTYRASGAPRMLSAQHATTMAPMLAEWQYEGDTTWTAATQWFDSQPWRPLYARTKSETYRLWPNNIIGNGIDTTATGAAAFVAMRDEVIVNGEREVDMVAWGNEAYGGKLEPNLIIFKNVEEITACSNAYTARLRTGHVLCWGGGMEPPAENGNFRQVRSNALAFAGLRTDGSLLAWGADTHGVPVPADVSQYKDYVQVCGAAMAFAAIRQNGQVKAWGDEANGGKLETGQDLITGVKQIIGNYGAFAALRDGGGSRSVFAWGNPAYGGEIKDDEIARATNVKALGAATAQAFTILLDTGGILGWGPDTHGGVIPVEIKILTNIVSVVSTWHAFCARLSNGYVVAWGNPDNGGNIPPDIVKLSDIAQVVGSAWSFAALRKNGTVVAWGDPVTGGDISSVAAQLTNVRAVYANSHGFTALTGDGRVVTWGQPDGGGNSDPVQGDLRGKVTHGHYVTDGNR